MSCRVCSAPVPDELCFSCARSLGLAKGVSARPALPCARCNHPELIRALVRELSARGSDYVHEVVAPMGVTYAPDLNRAIFSDRITGANGVQQEQAIGLLEMYVCRRCGFTEWYCRDPQNVPIAAEYGTELVDVSKTGGGPYR